MDLAADDRIVDDAGAVASRPLGQVGPWPDLLSARWGQVRPGSAFRTMLY